MISGRLRLLREDPAARPPVRVEEEVGRGEAVGAVWALTAGVHDTTAHCIRDSELVRLTKVNFSKVSCRTFKPASYAKLGCKPAACPIRTETCMSVLLDE